MTESLLRRLYRKDLDFPSGRPSVDRLRRWCCWSVSVLGLGPRCRCLVSAGEDGIQGFCDVRGPEATRRDSRSSQTGNGRRREPRDGPGNSERREEALV